MGYFTDKIEQFIKKASIVHNYKYSYNKSAYVNSYTPVVITCPIHGDFTQIPSVHLSKKGCAICGKSKKSNTEEFIEKAKKTHNDKYDYSKAAYSNKSTPVTIVCPIHGAFSQTPNDHLDKHGCSKCSRANSSKSVVLSNEEFIRKALLIHGNKYEYVDNYTNGRAKINILCKEHGIFVQQAQSHLRGKGCPKCKIITSKQHQEICDFLSNNKIEHTINDRNAIHPYELDILSKNIAIEYNGNYWHSLLQHSGKDNRHKLKADLCDKLDITLIQIFGDEWESKRDIVKSNILSFFNKNTCIVAEEINIILDETYYDFANKNYLFKARSSGIKYSLSNIEGMCAAISFDIANNNIYINEYITHNYINIINGFSIFLDHIVLNYKPDNIFITENRRMPLLFKSGFDLVEIIEPKCSYLDKNKKPIESVNGIDNYRVMFDAGYKKYILRIKK